MKIVKFQAENVKKLRAVEIVPNGNVVQVTGPNGSGKSSVLDAIFYALAGTKDIPSQPVRKGAKKARVKLDLGEIVVTRTFTEGGGTTLIVEGDKGARFPSPQKMLDDMLGTMSFDPLAFSRMDPKKQLEQLRGLVKIDIDLDALALESQTDYDLRTQRNRDVKSLRAQVDAIVLDPNAPKDPVDAEALLNELQSAGEKNAELERRKSRRAEASNAIKTSAEVIARLETDIQKARDEIARCEEAIESEKAAALELTKKLDTAEALPEPIDVNALRARLDQATAVNTAVANRQRRAELETSLETLEAAVQGLTDAIDTRAKQRDDAIAAAVMPVPGLSFGDGEVLYKGLPFDQASSAEQLRVSVAIAMSAHPKLRVMRIKDGSLLDENGMRLISELAASEDWQIWLEAVDTSGRIGIVMDDGNVSAVNLEAA